MTKADIEDKLAGLRLQMARLEKELEDRENLEKGVRVVGNPRPIPLRNAEQIKKDLNIVRDEVDNYEKALGAGQGASRTTERGALKEVVGKWAVEEGFEKSKSVSSRVIAKFVRELKSKGIETSENAVRATLSKLGYSKERDADAP